jgi:hypothetical protein
VQVAGSREQEAGNRRRRQGARGRKQEIGEMKGEAIGGSRK